MLSSNRFDIYFCIFLVIVGCDFIFKKFESYLIAHLALVRLEDFRFEVCISFQSRRNLQNSNELWANGAKFARTHQRSNTHAHTHIHSHNERQRTQPHIIDSSNNSNAAKVCSLIDELLIKHFACNNVNGKQQYSYWQSCVFVACWLCTLAFGRR